MAVADDAGAVDDERLGHAVDPPFDADAAVAVGADGGEGIAQLAEPFRRVGRLVLVVDAVERDAARLRQFGQYGMPDPAGQAQGGKEVEQAGIPLSELGRREDRLSPPDSAARPG